MSKGLPTRLRPVSSFGTQPDALLDTSVLIRHFMQDHEDHSRRATALLLAIERNERTVRLADTVIFEAVFTLGKTYGIARDEIRQGLEPILKLSGMVLPGKRIYTSVFDLWTREAGLSFADCYHLCLARRLSLPAVLTFDRKMNRLPGVARIEPRVSFLPERVAATPDSERN